MPLDVKVIEIGRGATRVRDDDHGACSAMRRTGSLHEVRQDAFEERDVATRTQQYRAGCGLTVMRNTLAHVLLKSDRVSPIGARLFAQRRRQCDLLDSLATLEGGRSRIRVKLVAATPAPGLVVTVPISNAEKGGGPRRIHPAVEGHPRRGGARRVRDAFAQLRHLRRI